MNQSFSPRLLDLLARSWQRPAAIAEVMFDAAGTAVLFRDAKGGLTLGAVADGEPASARMRMEGDVGRMTIRPRRRALPPLIEPEALPAAAAVAVLPRGGFAVGGADGSVHQVTPRGQVVRLRAAGGDPVQALAVDPTDGQLALALPGRVVLREDGSEGTVLEARARALAFAEDGTLAISTADGLWLCAGQAPRRYPLPSAQGPLALSGRWIAGACEGAGIWLLERDSGRLAHLAGFPTASRSVLLASGGTLVASGAFRLVAWSLDRPPFAGDHGGALATGTASAVAVTCAAAHPTRDLVAFSRAGGELVLARLGRPEELVLLPGSGDEITALAFAPGGRHMGLGTASGTAALVELPDMIFK
ncbi:High-affnity carbon uptake protein Hat/HatR [Rhodobacter sphaeroides]|uniref:Anaphase-promoting complex subunit 4 WD40 domain-containing protein n=1 Tax=Cereibacter sphaeroides (strain ATCC 17023 / DSM 158 / JCM 6121 / CCUG 31486 / LMG 2827 / NBRC 12203 / NCIMB 8253 / ATH 2.4.1.) TaxID=272943 RepID=Q3J2F8_CERS4|nr:hypothetical protein [Cereibacter sphaeroides]ABA79026.1 hypothetical protein RSP_2789 [Cereibacter sphaeroides 2.4.1]AMJ47346.1 High-affnity carbon uptake protein Hat/HatR [Cereibacter sphaeroides]ANS34059.1 High-affnity carbon uptake protein Hat/HatR [Cereibacter sphaeroides]ATN63103.1 High-affnity carbon uptake protein Hat/HatR [Cereibacter sphaeroides]AXC61232.1 High-affnity carbon uptake protein Hat/HatR [Cereibacter sphaeroides 2.4.1]